jgi:hypothetical protein
VLQYSAVDGTVPDQLLEHMAVAANQEEADVLRAAFQADRGGYAQTRCACGLWCSVLTENV